MQQTKQHPAFREAVARILDVFETKGYGAIILDEEFDQYMSLPKPPDMASYKQFRDYEMDKLQRYRAISILLEDHNICLIRSTEIQGFEILPPKMQVSVAYEKRMERVRRELRKAAVTLANIDHTLLTMEEEQDRQNKMSRTAFLKTASSRRKMITLTKGG